MSDISRNKAPVCLRAGFAQASRRAEGGAQLVAIGAGVVVAGLGGPIEARAQSAPAQLPALTVEAPREVAPRPKPRAVVRRQAAQSAAASPRPIRSARAVAGAPYRIDRAASSKMPERLIDTPRAVDSVSKEVMEDKGATSLRELARTTPGVTIGAGEGGNAFGDRVFIRGFDARNDMYIDGVRDSGVTSRETFMVEQVDVVKGPSGSISGRGATGGAINVVTKKPAPVNFYNFQTEIGNARHKRMTIDLNHNVNDQFAIRAGGLAQKSGVPGRDVVEDDRYGAFLSAQWRPSSAFKLSLDYYYMKFDGLPDWGVPFDPRTRRPLTESGLGRDNYYGLVHRDFQKNDQHMGTLSAEWTLSPFLTLSSRLRASDTTVDYVAGKPGTPNLSNVNPTLWSVPITGASRYQTNRVLNGQADATWTFDTMAMKHKLITGVEIGQERVAIDSYSGLSVECFPTCGAATTSPVVNLWRPNGAAFTPAFAPSRSGRPTLIDVDTTAFYALDSINWRDKLFLNLGARVDQYDIKRTPFASAALTHRETLFNWNVGATYKLLSTFAVYAAYATSSNPVGSEIDGGGEDYGALTASNQAFRAERNRMMEVGAKWELMGGKLLLATALFQTDKRNARETVNAVLSDSVAYRVRGVELGATGQVSEALSIYAGYVHMGSEVTRSLLAANRGRKLANIAHDSFNLLAKYKINDRFTVGGQATWKGEILGGGLAAASFASGTATVQGARVVTPAGYNKLPAGWRFDAFAEMKFNATFSAKIAVNNIFDTKLYDGFYRSGTPYVYTAPGRSAILTLNASF